MAATHTARDPRSIVTPDAFTVSEELLGKPLAQPRRRLAAITIDVLVIFVISLVTKSFALIMGFLAGAFFMWAGFKRTKVRNSVFGRAMRFSVGCLGFSIAVITAVIWALFGPGVGGSGDGVVDGDAGSAIEALESADLGGQTGGPAAAIAQALLAGALGEAETVDEVEGAADAFVSVTEEMGWDDEQIRASFLASVPTGVFWAADADRIISDELNLPSPDARVARNGATDGGLEEGAGPEDSTASGTEIEPDAAPFSPEATDSIRALEVALGELQEDYDRRGRALASARASNDDDGGGVFDWFVNLLDEIGFGFGLATFYMTVVLSAWNGQTVGKRLMGLRVVRLDGEPITWWTAFERVGGYAAGPATGLLGFAQVYWDANRQAIHDRIVGTVVVDDRRERVMNWEEAL